MDREINRPGKSLYFYCLDRDFGPFFLKFCSYCPALLLFQLLPAGFSNRNLRDNLAPLLGQQPADLTQGRMTYHLRRLRLPRNDRTHPQESPLPRDRLGLRAAWFFKRTYSRILRPGLGRILPELSQSTGHLSRCFDKLDQEVKSWVEVPKLAA